MLPGGLSVLGVFIITDSTIDILAPLKLVSQKPTCKTATVVVEMLQEYST